MISFLFRNSILFLNIIASISLFLGWLGSYNYSYNYAFIGIFALVLPVLFAINLLFTFFWLFSKNKKNILISLVPILLCLFILNRFYNFLPKNNNKGDFSLVSYNIKKFAPNNNLYSKNEFEIVKKKNFKLIDSLKPDILCLQEYSEQGKEIRNKFKRYILNSKLDNKKYRPTIILTNFPIVNHFSIEFNGKYANNVVADIKINEDTIRVFNIHMESLSLMSKNFSTLYNAEKAVEEYYKSLNNGFLQHKKQIDNIMSEVNKSQYPVILCGDFNNTPFSYEYNKTIEQLNDTYLEAGSGIIDTYHNIPFPTRIDNIFTSYNITTNSYELVDKNKISDHYPVKVTLSIKNNE